MNLQEIYAAIVARLSALPLLVEGQSKQPHIEWFRDQDTRADNAQPFPRPALLIEFEAEPVATTTRFGAYIPLTVRIHVVRDRYKDTRPALAPQPNIEGEVITRLHRFSATYQGLPPTQLFSSLVYKETTPSHEPGNLETTILTFQTTHYSPLSPLLPVPVAGVEVAVAVTTAP